MRRFGKDMGTGRKPGDESRMGGGSNKRLAGRSDAEGGVGGGNKRHATVET